MTTPSPHPQARVRGTYAVQRDLFSQDGAWADDDDRSTFFVRVTFPPGAPADSTLTAVSAPDGVANGPAAQEPPAALSRGATT
jgi:hypothetical protein